MIPKIHEIENLIILGSGPAALTAAVYAARAGIDPLVMQGYFPGGQLAMAGVIENWPGTISQPGYQLADNMKQQALKFNTRILSHKAVSVDFSGDTKIVISNEKLEIKAKSVIIATGAEPKYLDCPGEKQYWGKGVATCAVCDGSFYRDLPVIIVGGGNRAVENALFMTNYTSNVTMVQNLSQLTATQALVDQIESCKSIKLILDSTVSEISGNGEAVTQVTVMNLKTQEKQNILARAVFISIGTNPNTDIFKNQVELTHDGYILLKQNTQTSVAGVFSCGDVTDSRYRQAITSAASGCMAALDAEKYLKENHD